MKKIILISGPQGAGKSRYCNSIAKKYSHVGIISRDDFLLKKYGTTAFDRYTGTPTGILDILLDDLKNLFKSKEIIFFDYWNGFSFERKMLIDMFRGAGAEHVACWKFITPLYLCSNWYQERENSSFYSSSNYFLYHKESRDIHEEGFDSVRLVNPLQLTIPSISEL